MKRRQTVGKWGETVAEKYLLERGYRILDRNVHTAYGEIDLVACQGGQIVFVEVKARTNQAYGLPETSITSRKLTHMVQSAEAYIQDHSEAGEDWRIDVIAVRGKPGATEPEIVHFDNAIG
jgi:putative endonuclease